MQFIKKTSSSKSIIGIITKIALVSITILLVIFLLNKIDFKENKKEIEKIITNENFKIVK